MRKINAAPSLPAFPGRTWAIALSISAFLTLFSLPCLYAQEEQETISDTSDIFIGAFPLAFYLPETRWGFGGAAIMTFKMKNERDLRSTFVLGGAYTLNKQVLSYLSFDLYTRKNQISGEVGYYDYYYPYYGIGSNSKRSKEEIYYVRFPRMKAKYYYEARSRLYIGGQIHFDDYNIRQIEPGGLIETNQQKYADGGIISGLGLNFQRDHRDNIFFPEKGSLIEVDLLWYNDTWGSSFNFVKLMINMTDYRTLAPSHYLATNVYFSSVMGDVPFQELSLYGGESRARGYIQGRFRDRLMAILQVEYRFPIYWRFRGVVFGSAGDVGPNIREAFANIKLNYGAGLRFLLSKEDRLYLRLDYGRSSEGGEFYLTFGEAF